MKSYITFLSTDDYLPGVLVLNYSLQQVNSQYPLACMVTKNVSRETIDELEKHNISIIQIPNLSIPDAVRHSVTNKTVSHWNNAWDKLNIFNITQFDKIVYLDCDMIVYRNIDELFKRSSLTCATDGVWVFGGDRNNKLNAGLIVLEPNNLVFNNILSFINNLPSGHYHDQLILQKYFKDWKDYDYLKLPESYNLWVPHAHQYPPDILNNVKVLHYIGKIKPFSKDFKMPDENSKAKEFYELYKNYEKIVDK